MNQYLVVENDGALLLDAGLTVHEDALLQQIAACLPAGTPLSICPIRMGEFSGVYNVRPVAERFGLMTLYGMQERPMAWMDFRPEYRPSITDPGGGGALRGVPEEFARPGMRLSVGTQRVIEVLPAPLRLLPVTWMYDELSKTLMTADAWTWVWRSDERGPWVIADDDPVSVGDMEEHLIANRFWWLPGARTRAHPFGDCGHLRDPRHRDACAWIRVHPEGSRRRGAALQAAGRPARQSADDGTDWRRLWALDGKGGLP
jgi:hypothetical protein